MASLIRRATEIREEMLRQRSSGLDRPDEDAKAFAGDDGKVENLSQTVQTQTRAGRSSVAWARFSKLIHAVSLAVFAGGALLTILFHQSVRRVESVDASGESPNEAAILHFSNEASDQWLRKREEELLSIENHLASESEDIAETRSRQALASDILETFSFRLAQISSAAASGEFDTARADMHSLRREMDTFGKAEEPIGRLIAAQASTFDALETLIAAGEALRIEDQERIAEQAVTEYTRSLDAATQLAESLRLEGSREEAERSFRAALAQLPSLELAHRRLLEYALAEQDPTASVETGALPSGSNPVD